MPLFGSQTPLESHFLSKICDLDFPFWGEIFSNCKFLGFSSVILQNKFLVVKFITKIGEQKTSSNCYQKLKELGSGECWPTEVVEDYVKLEIAYGDPSFYENCYPYLWVQDMQYPKHV